MISGICTPQELRTLQPLLSPGELLRITAVLRDTAAGFNASANRRIDAELCLVRLCEPEASLDAESLNARLCRVEERLARGVVPVAAASAAGRSRHGRNRQRRRSRRRPRSRSSLHRPRPRRASGRSSSSG